MLLRFLRARNALTQLNMNTRAVCYSGCCATKEPTMTERAAARIARLERELKAARAAERKRAQELAERRRSLIGSVVLDRVARGLIAEADLRSWLDEGLTSPTDRAAFDLPPLQPAPEQPPDYLPETSANGY